MKALKDKPPQFQVGERVQFPFGGVKGIGEIVEDRGLVGIPGNRLYAISIPMDPDDSLLWIVPEEQLEPAPPPIDQKALLTKPRIWEYLKLGGLKLMLHSYSPEGKFQPRAWLCLTPLGNVTHTFVQERGVIGGATVPFAALWNDKIHKPKKTEVTTFLESFGLSKQEAERLIQEIGTSA
jgi:hypothetical protein